jgi:membrane-associated phospholipid phosphatase
MTSEKRQKRLQSALVRRTRAARQQLHPSRRPSRQPKNDDETRFGRSDNYCAAYSKGLPHGDHGEVDPDAFEALRDALETPGGGDFGAVPEPGPRPLTNPEAAISFNLFGIDPNDVYCPAAPAFDSAQTAAEMVELYWMALLRDVHFDEYDQHPCVRAAARELDRLTDYTGPTDPATLFRGTVEGTLAGPYVSQFFYPNFERGVVERDQRLRVLDPCKGEYLTAFDEWLAVQNGEIPNGGVNITTPGGPSAADAGIRTDERRYLVTGRDLATYVLANVPQQPYVNAALILKNSEGFDEFPIDETLPVDRNVPDSFVDYGKGGFLSLLGGIVQAHFHAAWYHKWRVHRRLRPEAYGGRVSRILDADAVIDGQHAADRYPIHDQLLNADAVCRVQDEFGTALLPQAYPEGGPTHPSYPAGHAVTAGSCATILKAYFDEETPIPNPVKPTADGSDLVSIDADLTVGGEINKLATNMAYARSWAGIHYRTDTTAGLRIGERIATAVLRQRLQHRPAGAYGSSGAFELTTFDGTPITITVDGVSPAHAFDPPLFP